MKTNWCLLTVAVLSWLMPQEAGASGACTAARIHDQNNLGCNQLFCGAGGQASGKLNAGGNQSTCTTGCGMPRWWVSEPYISLEMVDTPLSYTTSSGQEMAFRFYYSRSHIFSPAQRQGSDFNRLRPHRRGQFCLKLRHQCVLGK